MKISKTLNGTELTVVPEGRLDTNTSPQLEKELQEDLDGIQSLVMDFEHVSYISSAGLRVLLALQRILSKRDGMILRNVNDTIMEILEVTGFLDILTIE